MTGPPFLDSHLTYEYQCADQSELKRHVATLLEANTCFAVIGGELRIRFHGRGAQALGMTINEQPEQEI